MTNKKDEAFYVGYLPKAPAELGRWLRPRIVLLLLVPLLLGLVLVWSQKPFAGAVFEFQNYRDFEGVLLEKPYPMLQVARPGAPGRETSFSLYFLVAFGKHGAQEAIRGLDGQRARLRGSLVYREGQTMIELVEGSIQTIAETGTPAPQPSALGELTLSGEIVDSKCFLGVMNPGNLKVHRSCAVRCISGGIPPVLAVKDRKGAAKYFLLVSEDGGQVNRDVLPWVARGVIISGRLSRYGDVYVLAANPQNYRAWPER